MDRRSYLKTVGGAGAAAAFAGCLGDGGNGNGEDGAETITIGSDIPYPPFEYRTEEGELVGFDVEIAEAVFAGELGYEYEFQETSFDGIIPSLNNGNFRVIMSAMTINDERAEEVDFSDPYFTAYQTVLVLDDGNITSKEDLKGTQVGVQKGTTGEAAAEGLQEEFDGDLTIESYDQITGAFDALLNNQVDAVINDNTVSAEFANENDEVVFLEGEGEAAAQGDDAPPYLTLTIEEYGIAFRQDDDEFRQEVNDALATIREDGTYDEIYNEYFAA
ncbi:basic amino acid ABC transporter substrate-binding protein [Natronomonas halophila]|uniref:basic amino acid ABC transporter substrate-binding protein n=1 Tax=Natronomonas halophila TaxID=2747817 RepID=UPI0015B42C1B|nr:basic amino acid ABC transporter substrate-binding protein [Natronomonas halophila]